MTENVTNELIYSVLQQIQAEVSDIKFDVHDMKMRMTLVEEHFGHSLISLSGVNARLDRVNDRVERIERRLEIVEVK